MPTRNDNNKKILCCTGFAIQQAAVVRVPRPERIAFATAARAFVTEAAEIVSEDIPIPVEGGESNKQVTLILAGSVADAMGRLNSANFPLPAQETIDAYTAAAEGIAHL